MSAKQKLAPSATSPEAAKGFARQPSEAEVAIAQKWAAENAEAARAWAEWVEKRGLPLEQYRQF